MRFGLQDAVIEKIAAVLADYPSIKQATIFGSRAKGNFRSASDIDLALVGPGITLEILNKVSSRLDDLLIPVVFDLAIYDNIINQDLLDHIQRVGQVIYESGKTSK